MGIRIFQGNESGVVHDNNLLSKADEDLKGGSGTSMLSSEKGVTVVYIAQCSFCCQLSSWIFEILHFFFC